MYKKKISANSMGSWCKLFVTLVVIFIWKGLKYGSYGKTNKNKLSKDTTRTKKESLLIFHVNQ